MTTSGCRDLYSGILHKCGGRIKSWTKRWMVLRSDYCLYYYKDATKGHLGVISLRDTNFKIREGQRSDVAWPKNIELERTFALVTTPRVYFMYADSKAEAEEWKKVLEDAHQDLVEVTRTKSFSGYRSKLIDQTDPLGSQSVKVGSNSPVLNGARPKAVTSVSDSIMSTESSIFGGQYTLSLSSEMEASVTQVGEVESMYNVLQHPLVAKKKAQDTKGTPSSPHDQVGGADDVTYSEPILGEGGVVPPLPDSGAMYDVLYSSGDDGTQEDYELPPDAVESCPQNITVIVENTGESGGVTWAGSEGSGAGLEDKKRISKTSLEAFYDFAKAAGADDQRTPETVLYDEVAIDEDTTKDGESDNPHMTSALNQPLPAVPSPFLTPSDSRKECQLYEDIPDISPPTVRRGEAIYEPVGVAGSDGVYSEVEYDEGREGQGGVGEMDVLEETTGEGTPPLPDHPPSPPIPQLRVPTQREPDHLPRDRYESSQSPSNRHESPSNRQNDVPSPTSLSPRTSPLLPTKFSHPSPDGVPIPAKRKLSQSSGSPTSPIQPFQKKFSPPPPPHARTPARPPSPLLSDRRASVSDSSRHSSTSSNQGNEGSPDTCHRPRLPSLKEKGMALFQRRQQEVATLFEADTQRRKRNLSMLKGVQDDDTLSPDDKVLFAETLREVESERLKASEERFRWERERMQLEEERKQLEREKVRLREELERTKNEILEL